MSFIELKSDGIVAVKRALAHRMIELREVANLSQTEAATRAGFDRRNWIRIEKGETSPGLESLLRIQYAFGLDSLDALFGRTTGDLLRSEPPNTADEDMGADERTL
jgi:transcriptional regulator with XRE-family HTH domain